MAQHWQERTVQTNFGDVKLKGAPQLREQISLNGEWDEGGTVPVYGGESVERKVYGRWVDIADDWKNRIIKLGFLGVNTICDIYIDGMYVATHVGGWVPFDVDITSYIQAGKRFYLTVDVKSKMHEPVLDSNGCVQYPTGMGGMDHRQSGIVDDVWLRAYGEVYIEDTFIKTSWKESLLTLEYTLVNTTNLAKTVELNSEIINEEDGFSERELPTRHICLMPDEIKQLIVEYEWDGYELWWPDSPKLYHLKSSLVEKGTVIDSETRRFGFREIWIEKNQYIINGVRVNLFGSYEPFGTNWYTDISEMQPDTFPNMVEKLKFLNIRINRWHMHPPAQYLLDIADEMGLFIHCESILYARRFMTHSNKDILFENTKKWIKPWIVANRNHPCIIKWGASNEMALGFVGEYDHRAYLPKLEEEILKYDDTRPINFDGERDIGCSTVDYHYLEGYNKEPIGSIYSWGRFVHPDKPTGSGETLHLKSPDSREKLQNALERCRWWIGIWQRGMRYVNFTDVRPACYFFVKDDLYSEQATLLRNAYAPVALFDKEYDDLGIAPYTEGTLPALRAASREQRTLILYNDEFRDDIVKVIVLLKVNDSIKAAGEWKVCLKPGEHVEIPYVFNVPDCKGELLELILITEKNGVKKFEETRLFRIINNEYRSDALVEFKV